MTEAPDLISASQTTPAPAVRPLRRNRVTLLCALGWTLFVGAALWWLLRTQEAPSVWIIHEGDALPPALARKFSGGFKADLGLQRIYPWMLFGPYVALIVSCFPLERRQWRLSVPLNLAGCVAFCVGCQWLNTLTDVADTTLVVYDARPDARSDPAKPSTNRSRIETTEVGGGFMLRGMRGVVAQEGGAGAGRLEGSWPGALFRARQTNTAAGGSALPPDFDLPLPALQRRLAFWPALMDLLAYGAIAGALHSVHFYRRFREREHRAVLLESNLAQARLNALRAQLQPHFLFNSLNAIATLLRRDPRLAEATLMSLSDLLRLALSQSERPEVSLREELAFVRRYLEIQQTRFGDKLRVREEIDPEALDCFVPTLLLQPLVENAIRHGLEPADRNGLVQLTAHRLDGRLVLTVEDNGLGLNGSATEAPGIEPAGTRALTGSLVPPGNCQSAASARSTNGTGIGLANLRARLEALYGPRHKMELIPRLEAGVAVRIEIPWRLAHRAAPSP